MASCLKNDDSNVFAIYVQSFILSNLEWILRIQSSLLTVLLKLSKHYTELHMWTMCCLSEHSGVPAICSEGGSTEWRGWLESIPEVHSVCHLPGFETGQYWELLMLQWNLLKHYQYMCQLPRMGHRQHLNTSSPGENSRHFTNDIFKCIFL